MVASTALSAAPAAPVQQLVLGNAADPDAIAMALVKFAFRRPELIPAGIPKVDRQPDYKLDVARQLDAYRSGHKDVAQLGRVRKGRVDTGTQVIKVQRPVHAGLIRRGLANNGFRLTHLHWFTKDSDPKKDPKGQQDPIYTVCACFVRGTQAQEPERAHVEALRALAKLTWNNVYVWENPTGQPATLNFGGLAKDQKPKHTLVVRNGIILVEDVQDTLSEERE